MPQVKSTYEWVVKQVGSNPINIFHTFRGWCRVYYSLFNKCSHTHKDYKQIKGIYIHNIIKFALQVSENKLVISVWSVQHRLKNLLWHCGSILNILCSHLLRRGKHGERDENRLNKLVNKAGSVLDCPLNSIDSIAYCNCNCNLQPPRFTLSFLASRRKYGGKTR